jgi:hypothetical protein
MVRAMTWTVFGAVFALALAGAGAAEASDERGPIPAQAISHTGDHSAAQAALLIVAGHGPVVVLIGGLGA